MLRSKLQEAQGEHVLPAAQHSMYLLATQHCAAVVSSLLGSPLPLDRYLVQTPGLGVPLECCSPSPPPASAPWLSAPRLCSPAFCMSSHGSRPRGTESAMETGPSLSGTHGDRSSRRLGILTGPGGPCTALPQGSRCFRPPLRPRAPADTGGCPSPCVLVPAAPSLVLCRASTTACEQTPRKCLI